jgi:hypothetical protein
MTLARLYHSDVKYPVLQLMKSLNIELTRQNYIECAFLDKNYELSAEEDAELPPRFQRDRTPRNTLHARVVVKAVDLG